MTIEVSATQYKDGNYANTIRYNLTDEDIDTVIRHRLLDEYGMGKGLEYSISIDKIIID